VIKGSRPYQRKQATFWSEVESEAETLHNHQPGVLEQIHVEPAPEKLVPKEQPEIRTPRTRKPSTGKTRSVKTVKTARAESTSTGPRTSKPRASRKKAPESGNSGPPMRPSQRGFKWPASTEEA